MVAMKSMNVTFDDGTSHTFDDVPDEVTQDQVNAKATEMFPDRKIMDTNQGAHPDAPPPIEQTYPQVSRSNEALAGLKTAWDVGNAIASSPLGHAGELGAGLYGAAKLLRPGAPATPATPAAPAAPTTFTNGANPAWDQALKQPYTAPPAAPVAPATPPVGGPAAQQGSSFLENIAQKYANISRQFAPTLQGVAESPLGRVVGGAARIASSTPAIAAQLALHSGGLNTNEDRLLADKHRLEAQMLLNKHAAEWNKYQQAKQAVQGQ